MTIPLSKFRLFFIIQLVFILSLSSQTNNSDLILNKQILKEIIDTLTYKLENKYVLPDKATEMGSYIKKRYSQGFYNKITDPNILADILTKDVLSVHNDEHFYIEYNPKLAKQLATPDSNYIKEQLIINRSKNYGFKKVEILNGNIGYMDISYFAYLNKESERVAESAFQMLSNCKAIIIDLRYGMGGQPEMVCNIAKYFLKDKTHFMDATVRNRDVIYNFDSEPDEYFKDLFDVPLYILTSYKTFSAAEMLAFGLKNAKRATIVGEQTRGGAHNAPKSFLYKDFIIALPHGRAYSKITKTNWEGVGISPDINATADKALEVAELKIFEDYFNNAKDTIEKNNFKWQFELLKAKNNQPQLDTLTLKKRIGTYSYIDISFSNNNLYYERVGRTKFPLVPMIGNKMRFQGNDFFIVEFIQNSNGDVKEIITYYDDGRIERSRRNEKN